jgi:hypothetical protein
MKTQMPMKYLGGHPCREKATTATVTLDDDGVRARVLKDFLNVPWSDVKSLEVDGPDEVQRRVTATRLLATGVFAFALKKKTKTAYLTVTTPDGEAVFETDKMTPQELRAKVAWAIEKAG